MRYIRSSLLDQGLNLGLLPWEHGVLTTEPPFFDFFFLGVGGPLKNVKTRDFPGGPAAKTPVSQCRGPRFSPAEGTRSHMLLRVLIPQLVTAK